MKDSKDTPKDEEKYIHITLFRGLKFIFVIITLPIVGLLVYLGCVFLAGMPVGVNAFTDDNLSNFQAAQLIFWATIFASLFFISIFKLLKRYKTGTMSFTRNYLKLCIIIGTIIAFIGMFGTYFSGTDKASNARNQSCDRLATIRMAQSATYPISTDLGSGTAFAINGSGNLITAYHVVEGAKEIYVDWTTGRVPVKVLRASPAHDIALLKYPKPSEQFIPLTESYQVTDTVYAFGWPGNTFNAGQASAVSGIVSRILTESDIRLNNNNSAPKYLQMVQTDAAINPGNSGGPLINECGVVGVVSAKSDSKQLQSYGIVSEEGISFAISTQTINKVLLGK